MSDWSFDENCLFCCLRREKVKVGGIAVQSAFQMRSSHNYMVGGEVQNVIMFNSIHIQLSSCYNANCAVASLGCAAHAEGVRETLRNSFILFFKHKESILPFFYFHFNFLL